MVLQERYDYLITGAGSAGCVLARRLSDAGNKVLLIEAPNDVAANMLQYIQNLNA